MHTNKKASRNILRYLCFRKVLCPHKQTQNKVFTYIFIWSWRSGPAADFKTIHSCVDMTRFVKINTCSNQTYHELPLIWTHLNCSSPHLSQPTPQWPCLWMPHSGYGQDFCSKTAQKWGRWGWEQHFKRETLKFLRALETGQRITCHKDACVSTELFVLVPGWL